MYEIALQSSNTNKYVYSLSQNQVLGAAGWLAGWDAEFAHIVGPKLWAVAGDRDSKQAEEICNNLPFLFMKCFPRLLFLSGHPAEEEEEEDCTPASCTLLLWVQ